MQSKIIWKENMKFEAFSGEHNLVMDAKSPIGRGEGMTPKELLALSIMGCTAMDVAALMKKHKQPVESFEVKANVATSATGIHPAVFEKVDIIFEVKGVVDSAKLIEAVELSQTKYCGVSAMLSKAFPIHYRVLLNGDEISTGQASF